MKLSFDITKGRKQQKAYERRVKERKERGADASFDHCIVCRRKAPPYSDVCSSECAEIFADAIGDYPL